MAGSLLHSSFSFSALFAMRVYVACGFCTSEWYMNILNLLREEEEGGGWSVILYVNAIFSGVICVN